MHTSSTRDREVVQQQVVHLKGVGQEKGREGKERKEILTVERMSAAQTFGLPVLVMFVELIFPREFFVFLAHFISAVHPGVDFPLELPVILETLNQDQVFFSFSCTNTELAFLRRYFIVFTISMCFLKLTYISMRRRRIRIYVEKNTLCARRKHKQNTNLEELSITQTSIRAFDIVLW